MGEKPTHYAEFGVYTGNSMIAAAHAFSAVGIQQYHLVGFDSFQGLPASAELEDRGVWKAGQFACPKETAELHLQRAKLPIDRYTLESGWFHESLTAERRNVFDRPVSIVMIDCDAYSSARLALEFIAPCLADKSIVMFDDWKLNDLDIWDMGEKKAFAEFLLIHTEFSTKRIKSYSRKSSTFLLMRD